MVSRRCDERMLVTISNTPHMVCRSHMFSDRAIGTYGEVFTSLAKQLSIADVRCTKIATNSYKQPRKGRRDWRSSTTWSPEPCPFPVLLPQLLLTSTPSSDLHPAQPFSPALLLSSPCLSFVHNTSLPWRLSRSGHALTLCAIDSDSKPPKTLSAKIAS